MFLSFLIFFFKQKTAYEMRISDWSSDVCSSDLITEDIITDLARFRGLDVIARNSAAVYKGEAVDVRRIGRDLGVRYVLQGSIQRQSEQIRVTAQLIDASNGATLWSDRWDRPRSEEHTSELQSLMRISSAVLC